MPAAHATQARIGERLRARRHRRGDSLKTVADATGISASFLSLVETDRSDITFSRLARLLEHYGATFSDLVPEERPPADDVVMRGGEGRSLPSPGEGLEMFLLTHADKVMHPVLVEYAPGARLHEFRSSTGGESFILVLEGALEIDLEDHEPFTLGAGDSMYYDSARALKIANTSGEPARLVAVGIIGDR